MTSAVWRSLPYMMGGIGYTVLITIIALSVGFLIGTPIALARVYGKRSLNLLALGYTVVLRGVPPGVRQTTFQAPCTLRGHPWRAVRRSSWRG